MILQETLFINGAPLLNLDPRVFLELPEGEAALPWKLKMEQIGYVPSDVSPTNISDLEICPQLYLAQAKLRTKTRKGGSTLKCLNQSFNTFTETDPKHP